MRSPIPLPRWLLISIAVYLVGVVLWFDFFFWLAVAVGASVVGLVAFLATVGVVMHLVSPNIWAPQDRAPE